MRLFDKTLSTLERSLDTRLLRQNVLAGNLANIDTPGYSPLDVDFEAAMKSVSTNGPTEVPTPPHGEIPLDAERPKMRVLAPTNAESEALGAPIVAAQDSGPGLDGNAVDLDRTMAAMAQNALQYGASARAAGKKLAILRYVASDGAA